VRFVLGILVLVVTAGTATAQQVQPDPFIDGTAPLWRGVSDDVRTLYVVAYMNGAFRISHEISQFSAPACQEMITEFRDRFGASARYTARQIQAVVTDIYKDPANVQVPVFMAVRVVFDKLNGGDIEPDLRKIRQRSARMPGGQP
jgi:hypothetical protein